MHVWHPVAGNQHLSGSQLAVSHLPVHVVDADVQYVSLLS